MITQPGPIIQAIDAGHFVNDKTGECRTCRVRVADCQTLREARRAQPDYARALQQQRAIEAGQLSVPGR